MRPKFVLKVLLVAALVIGAIIFLKGPASAPVPDAAPAPVAKAAPPPMKMPALEPAPAPVVVKEALTPEERQAAIDAETDRLSEWAMNDDAQSLSNILNDLTSPEKKIQMAAIEAAKQFESTDAIPVLKAAAANAQDNEEAAAMLEAADWLALPNGDFSPPATSMPLTPAQAQAIAKDRTITAARRQAYLQSRAEHPGNHASPSTSGHGDGASPGQNPSGGSGN